MISVAEADHLLSGLLPAPSSERVPLEHAVGRVTVSAAIADRDGPPFARVAMDGYAIFTAEGRTEWTVSGFQGAGAAPMRRDGPGTAVETATGAALPQGCDAVVPYEDTLREGDHVRLKEPRPWEPFRHVHQQGSDYRQGDTLVPAGTRLRSVHLHTLASVGIDPVAVVRRPRWILATTGDELVDVGQTPEPWQIRRSNGAAIAGEARAWGLPPEQALTFPDDPHLLRQGLDAVVGVVDLVVLTGGVSAGALDFVPRALADLGVRQVFHKVAQRPGKPLWCGVADTRAVKTVVVGLPGNPVSSLFGFRRFVLPWLAAAQGTPMTELRLPVEGVRPPPDHRTLFLPWSRSRGILDWHGSGNFSALSESSGFLEIDDDPRSLTEPRVYLWGGETP